MKQKYYWIFGIIIVLIIIIVILIGNFQKSTPVTQTAQPVFESGVTVTSEDDIKTIFNTSSEEIITNTIEFITTLPDGMDAIYKQLLETKSGLFQYLTVEYKAWSNEVFWIPNIDKTYVVQIPLVSEDEDWSYKNGKVVVTIKTCNQPGDTMSVDEETGEVYCSSGIKEIEDEVQKLVYIVTNDGVVHFAGRIY